MASCFDVTDVHNNFQTFTFVVSMFSSANSSIHQDLISNVRFVADCHVGLF